MREERKYYREIGITDEQGKKTEWQGKRGPKVPKSRSLSLFLSKALNFHHIFTLSFLWILVLFFFLSSLSYIWLAAIDFLTFSCSHAFFAPSTQVLNPQFLPFTNARSHSFSFLLTNQEERFRHVYRTTAQESMEKRVFPISRRQKKIFPRKNISATVVLRCSTDL